MANYRLDELAEALQTTLRESQQRVSRAAGERLKSVVHIDEHGEPESLSWECRLPAGDGSERDVSILRVPWESIEQIPPVTISELSIAFDCDIEAVLTSSECSSVTLSARSVVDPNEPAHCIKVRARSLEESSVTINGDAMETFIAAQSSHEAQDSQKRKAKSERQTWRLVTLLLTLLAVIIYWFFLDRKFL